MKTYSVHSLPWSAMRGGEMLLIREGFNWPALIFGPFWALWHGMWRTVIALLVIGAVLGGIGALAGLAPDAVSLLQFLVQVGLGLWGNDLRRLAVARRGYVERAVVAGRNEAEAEQRYFTVAAPEAA